MTASLPLFLIALIFMPFVSAAPQTQPFPEISFKVFSMFIEDTFGPKISLAIVFLILFLITKNPELLSLHTHQQYPSEDKNKISASENLFQSVKFVPRQNHQVLVLSTKLDKLATLLNFTSYDSNGNFKCKLLPLLYTEIQAVHVICSSSTICITKYFICKCSCFVRKMYLVWY